MELTETASVALDRHDLSKLVTLLATIPADHEDHAWGWSMAGFLQLERDRLLRREAKVRANRDALEE